MRLIKVADLAKLGIPRRTINKWIANDRSLAVWIPLKGHEDQPRTAGHGEYRVRLDRLEGRPGIGIIDALMLGSSGRWVKISELAAAAHGVVSRWTLTRWCRTRPGFGKRIGRLWYVDLEQLGASGVDVDRLFGNSGQTEPHQE